MLLLFPKLKALINNKDYNPELVWDMSYEQLRSLVPYYRMIQDNYRTLRTLLANKQAQEQRYYLSALLLAELLERLNWLYVEKQEIPDLLKQQRNFRYILNDLGYVIALNPPRKLKLYPAYGSQIRENHPRANFFRLCVIRGKKVFASLRFALKQIKQYQTFLQGLENLTPILNYLSWLAFLPRLSTNFYGLYHCLIEGSWLTEEEKQLGWQLRLQNFLALHGFELANDIPWFIAGLLGCFLLLGSLSFISTYLTVGLFAYDIVVSGIRSAIALIDLYVLKEQYSHNECLTAWHPEKARINALYTEAIDQHIRYQQLQAALSMFNSLMLFGAGCLTIPAIAVLNIWLPVVAAGIIILVTLLVYGLNERLRQSAPPTEVLSPAREKPLGIKQLGLFNIKDKLDDKKVSWIPNRVEFIKNY